MATPPPGARTHLDGRVTDRIDDVLVAGAAAQVPRERLADLELVFDFRALPHHIQRGHQHPRSAEAALQRVVIAERPLKGVQLAGLGEALHGRHLRAVGLNGEQQARPDRLAVEQYRARPANPVLATEMRAPERKPVAENVRQMLARLDFALHGLAVHRDRDLMRAHASAPSNARRVASRNARSVSVAATSLR